MPKLKTLRVLEDELGTVLKSGMSGESLYYSARWEEIRSKAGRVARLQGLDPRIDVRCASYALTLLGVPNHYSEADADEKGNWIVYWR
jgi:hypothetical protein